MSEEYSPVETGNLSQDVLFDVLSHTHRRALLECLDDHGVSLALADVAEEVALLNSGRSIQEISPDDIKRIYMSLYHSHVPKLAAEGFVEYDQGRDIVNLTDRGAQLAALKNRLDISRIE